MKRQIAIAKAKIAGYENDTRTFTRLLVESRVRREVLNEAWQRGAALRTKAPNIDHRPDFSIGNPGTLPAYAYGPSIVGTIPAEESDEEFARQVERIS